MRYYLKDGTPCSMLEFAVKFEDKKYRQVAWTELGSEDEYVSTVWMGIDHSFGGKPIIFETMAYYDGDWREQRRYRTEAEALKGHHELVEELRARAVGPKYGRMLELN